MKKLFCYIAFSGICFTGKAQVEPVYQNAAYLEFAGSGLLLSANYERILTLKPMFALRAGFGIYPSDPVRPTIPVSFGYLLPLKHNEQFVELAAGLTYTQADVRLYKEKDTGTGLKKIQYFNFIPSLSYRVHARNGSIFKFSITPVFNQHGCLPYFGVSYGKMF